MPYPPVPINNGSNFTKTIYHDTYAAIDSAAQDHSKHYVFITGASKGVGRVLALSYAKAGVAGIALGARSDLAGVEQDIISAAQRAGKAIPRVLKLKLDVTNWADVESAAKETEREFGRLDILVNNAGFLSAFKPIVDSDRDEYWGNYEVNVKGVFLMCRVFVPLLLRGGEMTVVNLTSAGAHGVAYGASGYQTTKFTLLRFTEYLMVEYGEKGMLAYCVHPGGVPSEMSIKMPEQLYKAVIVDKAELAGDTISFLTAARRDWLAGRYISVNWDMLEFLGREDEIVKGDKLKMRMTF
ncbi:Short chain dehydrogenase citE [Lachnellula arida]|uniref:Short chain dehydrogenase citE n=1 Tax=Lachnellula arida TaxID=1316785 RepID=A0A8T9BF35_9HELO|nr:Short chain dehydrogenase citE [Lachnellula arida]